MRVDLKGWDGKSLTIELESETTYVRGTALLDRAAFGMHEGLSRVRSAGVRMTGFELRLGEIEMHAPTLTGEDVHMGWGGPEGFWMRARSARAESLAVRGATWAAELQDVKLGDFELLEGDIAAAEAGAGEVTASLDLAKPSAPPETRDEAERKLERKLEPKEEAPGSGFDPRVLNALEGEMAIDVGLVLRLAGGLKRRATHPFRLQVRGGSIDFRRLERGLSILEDLLLDFSLRDDALVLELGLPLLPTRGRGKPLVRWPLDKPAMERARERRVLLSTLFKPELGKDDDESEPPAERRQKSEADKPSTRLISADLHVLPTRLQLPATRHEGRPRLDPIAFDQGRLQGRISLHPEGEPAPGELVAGLEGLKCHLPELRLGERTLRLALGCDSVDPMRLTTLGAAPRHLELHATGLRLEEVRWAARPDTVA